MAKHLEYGKETEDRALQWFLARFPVRLISRNYRCKMGELDLVFEQSIEHATEYEGELIFVEVRARQAGAWVSGVESIGPKKLQRLRKAVNHFLVSYTGRARKLRVDVLSWDGEVWTHLPNIWF
jgi:putative endonuclease